MTSIDVIIPTKDRPALTRRAARSVLEQGHRDLTLFVADDGSTEENLEQLRALEREDERVRVLRCTRSAGPNAARQIVLEHGSAGWVATLDSDDVWLPGKLEKQLALVDDETDVVLTWFAWIAPDGRQRAIRRPRGRGRVSPTLTNNFDIPLIRRTTLEAAGGFVGDERSPSRFDEHTDFFVRLLAVARVAVVEEVLAHCFDHPATRESDGISTQVETLAALLEARQGELAPWPDAHADLLAGLGARHMARHERAQGWTCFRRALALSSAPQRLSLLRRYGPYLLQRSVFPAQARRG